MSDDGKLLEMEKGAQPEVGVERIASYASRLKDRRASAKRKAMTTSMFEDQPRKKRKYSCSSGAFPSGEEQGCSEDGGVWRR